MKRTRLSAIWLQGVLFAWLTVSLFFLWFYRNHAVSLEFGSQIKLGVFLPLFAAAAAISLFLYRRVSAWAGWQPALLLISLALFLASLVWFRPSVVLIIGVCLILAAAVFWFWCQPIPPAGRRTALITVSAAAAVILFQLTRGDLEAMPAVSVQPPGSLLWTPLLMLAALLIGVSVGLFGKKNRDFVPVWRLFAAAALLLHIVLLSALMTARVRSLYTPTYDFGLFTQMFHYMRETGLPLTTLERSREMSHFAVHVSPVFYLWLPFYALIPRPETLQVLQIVTVAFGVIPLFLIASEKLSHPILPYLLAVLYLFHPGIIGSSMYDVHENAFLAPLMFWLLWAAGRKKTWLYFMLVLLTLAVKEDAALYVVSVGIFLIPDKETRWLGLASVIMSLAAFFIISGFLNEAGEGVMTYRFENLVTDESWGLAGVLLTVLINPGYVVSELFSAEKLHYLQKMLLPLALLPLLQRRLRSLTLLFPLIVMNLVSRYQYQADIGFQYHYGTTALLFYLAILFFADAETKAAVPAAGFSRVKPLPVIMTLMLSAGILFGSMLYYSYSRPLRYAVTNRDMLDSMRADMDAIEDDASVRATTFLTTYLSDRRFIIDLGYEDLDGADTRETDYLVFDRRRKLSAELETRLSEALTGGYDVFRDSEHLTILKKRD